MGMFDFIPWNPPPKEIIDSKKKEIEIFGLCRCPSAKFFYDNYTHDERAYLWNNSDEMDKDHMREMGAFGYNIEDWGDVW